MHRNAHKPSQKATSCARPFARKKNLLIRIICSDAHYIENPLAAAERRRRGVGGAGRMALPIIFEYRRARNKLNSSGVSGAPLGCSRESILVSSSNRERERYSEIPVNNRVYARIIWHLAGATLWETNKVSEHDLSAERMYARVRAEYKHRASIAGHAMAMGLCATAVRVYRIFG